MSATFLLNIGMKAAEKAPSANSARNMLGIRQAIVKASEAKFAPTNCANSMSRARPSTRLTSVSPPTDPKARVKFMCLPPKVRGGSGLARAFAASFSGRLELARSGLLLSLLRLQLGHIGRGEVNRIEEQRREAACSTPPRR